MEYINKTRAVCKTCMPPYGLSVVVASIVWICFCHCELDLWPSDLISIGVICQSWSMYLCSFMIIGLSILELSSGNHFTVSRHRDLDLWPTDLKINRGHLQVMINVPMKFHDPKRKLSWVIIRKPFYYVKSPWPWPLT
jgi:hypothetical protein